MEPNPAQVVQDTLKTLIANIAKSAPLNGSDMSLLHFWLSEAIVEHNQKYEVTACGIEPTPKWLEDMRESLRTIRDN